MSFFFRLVKNEKFLMAIEKLFLFFPPSSRLHYDHPTALTYASSPASDPRPFGGGEKVLLEEEEER